MFSTRLTVPRSFLAPSTTKPSTCCALFPVWRAPLLTRLSPVSDSSILPEELATQSVRLKEEQLRREEEKVRGYRWQPRGQYVYMTLFKAP